MDARWLRKRGGMLTVLPRDPFDNPWPLVATGRRSRVAFDRLERTDWRAGRPAVA